MKISPIAWLLLLSLAPTLFAQQSAPVVKGWQIGNQLPDDNGLTVEWQPGQRINLQIVDNQLRGTFINAKGLIETPAYPKVVARLEHIYDKQLEYHLPLKPNSAGGYLTSPRRLYPPYDFRVTLIFLPEDTYLEKIVLSSLELRQDS